VILTVGVEKYQYGEGMSVKDEKSWIRNSAVAARILFAFILCFDPVPCEAVPRALGSESSFMSIAPLRMLHRIITEGNIDIQMTTVNLSFYKYKK
jgi:hypothetical protein